VDPPLPDVVAVVLTMSAVAPNLSPYTVLGAIVPVAAAVELIEPVVTVDVTYLELDDPPKLGGPTTTSRTAPTPMTMSAIAASLAFIHPCLSCLREVTSGLNRPTPISSTSACKSEAFGWVTTRPLEREA
jgi:hypothetical protein